MKKIILKLILFSSLISFSQNTTSGTASYRLYINFEKEQLDVDKKYGLLQKAIDISDKLEYKLIFKGDEANFYLEKNEKLDKSAVYFANTFSNVSNLTYQNLKTATILDEILGDGYITKKNEFVTKSAINKNWEITNESKLIGEYLCYKATTIKKIKKVNTEVNETVTAWFCPKLPFSFGPTKYAGLPGLILELQEKNIAFVIQHIQFQNTKEINIPKGKNVITEEELNKIISDRFDTLNSMTRK